MTNTIRRKHQHPWRKQNNTSITYHTYTIYIYICTEYVINSHMHACTIQTS